MLLGIIHGLFITGTFVGSLYLWKDPTSKSRNDPEQVRKRFISCFAACAISFVYVAIWNIISSKNDDATLLQKLGVHFGIGSHLLATFVALFLNTLLFLGPVIFNLLIAKVIKINTKSTGSTTPGSEFAFEYEFDRSKVISSLKEFVTVYIPELLGIVPKIIENKSNNDENYKELLLDFRNYIVGPIAEEWVFRSCLCYLLHFSAGYSVGHTILAASLFFGLAHIHHVIEHIIHGDMTPLQAIASVVFQLSYTSLFASYCNFIFLRTGSILAGTAMHTYCNYMGVPAFGAMMKMPKPISTFLSVTLVGGLITFLASMFPLTNQFLFNSVYYMSE